MPQTAAALPPVHRLAERILVPLSPMIFWLCVRLPCWCCVNRMHALSLFLLTHRRLPGRELAFNDVLHRKKTDGSLELPLVVRTTDKELAKEFIEEVLGPGHAVPTLAVLRSPEEIDAYDFPRNCYVKGTASSGDVMVLDDGPPDRERLKTWLTRTHYPVRREGNYKWLTQKIIVEPFVLGDRDATDTKFFVYRGRVGIIVQHYDRRADHTCLVLDRDWNSLDCSLKYPMPAWPVPRPDNLEAMVAAAEALGAHFDFVRIDMYTNGKTFAIGEITHTHGSAEERILPAEAEARVNEELFGSAA